MESDMLQPWGMQYNNKLTPLCHCPLLHRKRTHLTLLGNKGLLASSVLRTFLGWGSKILWFRFISQSWIFFFKSYKNTQKPQHFWQTLTGIKADNMKFSFYSAILATELFFCHSQIFPRRNQWSLIQFAHNNLYTPQSPQKYKFCHRNEVLPRREKKCWMHQKRNSVPFGDFKRGLTFCLVSWAIWRVMDASDVVS